MPIKHSAFCHSHFQPPTENALVVLQTNYAIYNLEIVTYAIYLPNCQVKTCISFSSYNIEQFCGGSWIKSLQSFPLEFLASYSPSLSSSNWQHNLLLGHPTRLFTLNFNSNTFLSIKPACDDITTLVL
jgi:hypothetical protein